MVAFLLLIVKDLNERGLDNPILTAFAKSYFLEIPIQKKLPTEHLKLQKKAASDFFKSLFELKLLKGSFNSTLSHFFFLMVFFNDTVFNRSITAW